MWPGRILSTRVCPCTDRELSKARRYVLRAVFGGLFERPWLHVVEASPRGVRDLLRVGGKRFYLVGQGLRAVTEERPSCPGPASDASPSRVCISEHRDAAAE